MSTYQSIAKDLEPDETVESLHFAMNIFSVCEQLATTLQKKGILAQTVMTGVNALRDNLQRQRNDYDFFFEQTIDKANALSIVCQPVLPRLKKVPRRLQHGNSVQHQHDSPKSMF
jgi:uncharacterized protein (DUF927 family)